MAIEYSIDFQSVTLQKFDQSYQLDILPQVHEISIFESLFSTILRCEIVVYDFIGLFVNFPLSGEEFIKVTYKNVADGLTYNIHFVIDSVTNINISDNTRSIGFIIKGVALEALANSLQTIQQAYEGDIPSIARNLFEEHINNRILQFLPSYQTQSLDIENNETLSSTVVIPNLNPFAAMDMLSKLAVPEIPDRYSYVFFQTPRGFNLKTIQGLTQGVNARRFAKNNSYKYLSNEISEKGSTMRNDERVVASLTFNKRHASLQKISAGYFHNNYTEINIAQKAIWNQHQKIGDVKTIYKNPLNTQPYINFVSEFGHGDEESNRTKYVVTTQREGDVNFPISRMRARWGQDNISNIAMSQVDLTITIPGTNRFKAGDLFFLDISEMHGFNEMDDDDLISGLYLITDIKHIIVIGGVQSTVLRINKDSYLTTIDRPTRYAR